MRVWVKGLNFFVLLGTEIEPKGPVSSHEGDRSSPDPSRVRCTLLVRTSRRRKEPRWVYYPHRGDVLKS